MVSERVKSENDHAHWELAGPAWLPNDPPQAWTAWRNADAAEPVGCGCGAPPPPGWPFGRGLIPCFSRHCRNAELCDGAEPRDGPEFDVLADCEPHPASATAAARAAAARATDPDGRATRRTAARR